MNDQRPCACDRCGIGTEEQSGDCHLCWLYHNVRKYSVHWGGPEEGPDLPIVRNGRVQQPRPAAGPGTELKRLLLDLGITGWSGCGCESMAAKMNRWGPEGCREHRVEIVAWLNEKQAALSWTEKLTAAVNAVAAELWLNPLDPAGSLVDEAIRRTENPARRVG